MLFSLFSEWLLKNPFTAEVAVTKVHFLWAAEQKKIIRNWDKCAEYYSVGAALSVLMGNSFEDIIYTLLAYSFSFVLLLVVTSPFF